MKQILIKQNKEKYSYDKKDVDKSMSDAFKQNDKESFNKLIRVLAKR